MTRILFSWIGEEDLEAARRGERGPLEAVLAAGGYHEAHVLSAFSRVETSEIAERLWERTKVRIVQNMVTLPRGGETHFVPIFAAATSAVTAALDRTPEAQRAFHLGSGTGAMIATWIILARTRYPAGLVQFSRDRGAEEADVPFDVSAEFVARAKETLLAVATEPGNTATGDPDADGQPMAQTLQRAEQVAASEVAVLLEGEPGVETEALARFVHEKSRRAGGRFVSFRCRAVPRERLEAMLFGRAAKVFEAPFEEQPGQLELARGATIFLDEIGVLPLEAQARLSSVLAERAVTRIGAATSIPVDVRIIVGTSRELALEVSEGRVLEDLYLQLSIAAIRIPPVRERRDELPDLIERLLDETNARCSAMTPKRLSPEARSLLLERAWPGNEAEIRNALTRLVVWAEREVITESDVRTNLPQRPEAERGDGILGRPFERDFRMEDVLDEVSRSYIVRALRETGGVKAKAVELLGMSNATTLTNWMKRLGLDGSVKSSMS